MCAHLVLVATTVLTTLRFGKLPDPRRCRNTKLCRGNRHGPHKFSDNARAAAGVQKCRVELEGAVESSCGRPDDVWPETEHFADERTEFASAGMQNQPSLVGRGDDCDTLVGTWC